LTGALRRDCLGLPIAEIVEVVLGKTGLRAHYEAERDGADRLENLAELISAATRFEGQRGGFAEPQPLAVVSADSQAERDPRLGVLEDFLAHASLEAGEHQADSGADALQLMTVHSAKGLEFHSVFISGLEEGLFPHENSLTEPDGLEEERRLMYVALTRARRRLYLSHAQSRMLHGQSRYHIASRFLHEIPESLLRRVNATRVQRISDFGGVGASGGVPTSQSPWRVGQSVSHPKFGSGVIVSAEGRGADARVQVNFREGGMKWLALEYARLTAS
jgi:DNA helicase-2/ATP-dependent DNA helicase PcrA